MLFVSALCAGLLGAGSASAFTVHECRIGSGTGFEYTNGTCGVLGAGGFQWVPITGTNNAVEPENASTMKMSTTVGGVKFAVACTGTAGSGVVGNSPTAVGSEIKLTYSGCSVTEPAGKGCSMPASITTVPLEMEAPAMNVIYEPEAGSEFVTFEVSGCSISALNGKKEITGSASAVVSASGTTQEFTATSGSSLKFASFNVVMLQSLGGHTRPMNGGQTIGYFTP
ncbi:MAG TPA: hypothetical protein VLL27_02550 [Solirubrobacterales bacterium]|nr:hypothetical protein [Solirubrobacterales bacterium]